MREYAVPGVALGLIADGVVPLRGFGLTSVEDSIGVDAHTVFSHRFAFQDLRGDCDDAPGGAVRND